MRSASHENCRRIPRDAFTLVEFLVVVAVVAVLLALLMAGIQASRSVAERTACANNLQQIGFGAQNYLSHNDRLPSPSEFEGRIRPYVKQELDTGVYKCPTILTGISYGYNTCIDRMQLGDDGRRIIGVDGSCVSIPFTGASQSDWLQRIDPRHKGLLNALHFDGSVAAVDPSAVNPYDPVSGEANIAAHWRPAGGCNGDVDHCQDGSLMAIYYPNVDFTGPSSMRKETTLHLPWGCPNNPVVLGGNPPYNIPQPPGPSAGGIGSVRIFGKLRADATDVYTFWMSVDDDGQLYLNNTLFYRRRGSTVGANWQSSGPIALQQGQWIPFELRVINDGRNNCHVSLQWATATDPNRRQIPMSCLSQQN